MDSFASVWDAAGDDAEQEQGLRALTSARIQVAPVWSFLAAAQSREEFAHRLALVEDRVREAADERGVSFDVLAKSLAADYHEVEKSRPVPKVAGVRTLSIFKVTAGDDSSAYYVVDEDSGKKVGGPYDDAAAAKSAISGGDVEGDNLSVEKGGGSDSDDSDDDDSDDSDDDKDSGDDSGKKENPFAKKDDSDDDSKDDDDKDSKDDDDKGGNPFAKKESALQTEASHSVVHQPGETVFVDHFMGHDEHEGRKGVWASVVASPGQHGYEDRADSHLLKPMAPGGTHFFHHFGSLNKTAHTDDDYRRNYQPGVGSYSSHEDYMKGGKPHGIYDSLGSAEKHLSDRGLNGWPDGPTGYKYCDSCDHVYSQDHPAAAALHPSGKFYDDHCPNCGDTGTHDDAGNMLAESRDYAHDHDDHYGVEHSEDNYGDPYGRHDQRMEGSKKTALADGVDPLAWVISTVPAGEGTPEKPVEHNDTQVQLTSALVDRFRAVHASLTE